MTTWADRHDTGAYAQCLADLDGVIGEPHARGWLTAVETARLLGVRADWVRAHRVELGGARLGDGPCARMRFPRDAVDAYLEARRFPADRVALDRVRVVRARPSRHAAEVPALHATGEPVMDW